MLPGLLTVNSSGPHCCLAMVPYSSRTFTLHFPRQLFHIFMSSNKPPIPFPQKLTRCHFFLFHLDNKVRRDQVLSPPNLSPYCAFYCLGQTFYLCIIRSHLLSLKNITLVSLDFISTGSFPSAFTML